VETKTQDASAFAGTVPETLTRFQFSNHLGSASLELDQLGQLISYEEYFPYGNASYQAVRSTTEAPKRYRYTGKERDEESGLYYYGARYYSAGLGRWTNSDPAGLVDGLNMFLFSRANPIVFVDRHGHQSSTTGPDDDIKTLQAEINALNKQKSKTEGLTLRLQSALETVKRTEAMTQPGDRLGAMFFGYTIGSQEKIKKLSQAIGILSEQSEAISSKIEKASAKLEGLKFLQTVQQEPIKEFEVGKIKDVKAIVLHRTGGSTKSSAISAMKKEKLGIHFIVDTSGTVTQHTPFKKFAQHVGGISPKGRFPFSSHKQFDTKVGSVKSANLIGIEVVGAFNKTTGLFDTPTERQLSSVSLLVKSLQAKYGLADTPVLLHGFMSPKKWSEGVGLGFDPQKEELSEDFIKRIKKDPAKDAAAVRAMYGW
jgi:RHS repeat-associated protein